MIRLIAILGLWLTRAKNLLTLATIIESLYAIVKTFINPFRKKEESRMAGKFGIDNLKKLVDLGIGIQNLAVHMIKNGKNWAADAAELFADLPSLFMEVSALAPQISQIPLEIKDIDPEEGVELIAYVVAKETVSNEKASDIIAASLKLVSDNIIDIASLVKASEKPVAPVTAPVSMPA